MSETIVTKRCCTCKHFKSPSEFHKSHRKRDKDGLQPQCKTCKKQYQQQYRKTEKGKNAQKRYKQSPKGKNTFNKCMNRYRIIHPEYEKAVSAVQCAVQIGKLPRPNSLQCSCGKSAKQYHHYRGYAPEHRLDVVAVCNVCHSKLHNKKGATPKGHSNLRRRSDLSIQTRCK